jgi:putative phosphoesterase
MKIAVLSDTHNQEARVRRALDVVRDHGVKVVLHCGDIEDPPIVELFRDFEAHFVLGNCDWDRAALTEAIEGIAGTLHEDFGHLESDGKQIAFLHGHEHRLLADLEAAGCYDYLFHGHTHVAVDRMAGRTRVINPGALHRAKVKTFVVLDVVAGSAETVAVE